MSSKTRIATLRDATFTTSGTRRSGRAAWSSSSASFTANAPTMTSASARSPGISPRKRTPTTSSATWPSGGCKTIRPASRSFCRLAFPARIRRTTRHRDTWSRTSTATCPWPSFHRTTSTISPRRSRACEFTTPRSTTTRWCTNSTPPRNSDSANADIIWPMSR